MAIIDADKITLCNPQNLVFKKIFPEFLKFQKNQKIRVQFKKEQHRQSMILIENLKIIIKF